jgi:two-component system, OmpR family, sensor kinase
MSLLAQRVPASPRDGPSTGRALETLELLLAEPASDLASALTHACNLVTHALSADKVDAFLYDERRESLVAVGTSTQPLSDLEKRVGLDVLPVANGGRVVQVFKTGQTFINGHLDQDPEELKGVKEALGIRSQLGVPLEVGGQRRGMMMIASQAPDLFTSDDILFAESVVRWVGMVAHRAELVETITRTASEEGRRAGAEELVTLLAHDMRNLLSPISTRLSLVKLRASHDDRAADLKDADGALLALQRVRHMIDNILDVARIERGMFELSPGTVDLTELTRDVARVLSTPGHAVEVAAPGKTIVVADAERVRQCVENLVSNAIQHSPEGAPVTVVLRTERHDQKDWVRIEVCDEGPGVAPDILPHIFDRFVSSRHSRGLGLGLYVARRIAEAHGGKLTVQTGATKGTTMGTQFILTLPSLRDGG